MAKYTINPTINNTILQSIEGYFKWDTHKLSYHDFFTESVWDKADLVYEDYSNEKLIEGDEGFESLDLSKLDFVSSYRNTEIYSLVKASFKAYSNVIDMSFTYKNTDDYADIKILGYKFPTDSENVTTWGQAEFPGDNPRATGGYEAFLLFQTDYIVPEVRKGGTGYHSNITLHEIGHLLGLGHPHDNGNFTTTFQENGLKALDNIKYTVMSYKDSGADTKAWSYGYNLTPMAIDIAALQHMYGANTEYNNKNTTYYLTDAGTADYDTDGSDNKISIGQALYCIWDTGGSDSISYKGKQSAYLNLNTATLDTNRNSDISSIIRDIQSATAYKKLDSKIRINLENADYHAGGFFSQIYNSTTYKVQSGGYSIAKGVRIEKASGGNNADFIIGNQANNTIYGNNGNDILHGSSGNDVIYGNAGNDRLFGGTGDDKLYVDNGGDWIYGGAGFDILDYTKMKTSISINLAKNLFNGSTKGARIREIEQINATSYNDYVAGTNNNDVINSYSGNDKLYGFDGNDKLAGGKGNDRLTGGRGADTLYGSLGGDYFYYNRILESTQTTRDTIKDFEHGKDKLYLTFDFDKADLAIEAMGNYNLVQIAETDFEVRVNKNITLADIVIA